jgi:hypothetical protein
MVTVVAEMDPPLISKPLLFTPVPLDRNVTADTVELLNWTASPASVATPVSDSVVPAVTVLLAKEIASLSPVPPVQVADIVIAPVAVSVLALKVSTSELPVLAMKEKLAAERAEELRISRPSPESPAIPVRLNAPVTLATTVLK